MARLSRRKKTLLFFVALVVYAGCVALLLRGRYIASQPPDQGEVTVHVRREQPNEGVVLPPLKEIPAEKLLDVPFLVQAPFANWDELHQETCEEASLMMVKYFKAGERFLSLEAADQEMKALVAWETEAGYKVDVTVAELSAIAERYYSLTTGRVILNPSIDDIKREIADGRPVILPAAGRLLGNPNFTGQGPPYHMLVIKGYTNSEFITNDPGTRQGESYRYSHQTIMEAMHDWHGSTSNILQGKKAILVFD